MTPAKPSKTVKPVRWTLGNGSLLIMQGDTQVNWKVSERFRGRVDNLANKFYMQHEIPKETKVKNGRISLTFRQIL